jgi:hypothetical protein
MTFGRKEAEETLENLSKNLVRLREFQSLKDAAKEHFEAMERMKDAKTPEKESELYYQKLTFSLARREFDEFASKVRDVLAAFGLAVIYSYKLFTGGKEMTDALAVMADTPPVVREEDVIRSEIAKLFFVDILGEERMALLRSPPLLEMAEVDRDLIDWMDVWILKLKEIVIVQMFGREFADGDVIFPEREESVFGLSEIFVDHQIDRLSPIPEDLDEEEELSEVKTKEEAGRVKIDEEPEETGLGAEIGFEIGAEMGDSLGAKIGAEIGAEIGDEIGAKMGDEIGDSLGAEMGAEMGAEPEVTVGVTTVEVDVEACAETAITS